MPWFTGTATLGSRYRDRMQSTFDERNWLLWLVRVRIFILTLLLAIELAVARFSPAPLPMRLFIATICLWYSLSLFYVLLLSFWQEHRLQASLQVVTDLVLVSLVVHETGGWDACGRIWSQRWLLSCTGRCWN